MNTSAIIFNGNGLTIRGLYCNIWHRILVWQTVSTMC